MDSDFPKMGVEENRWQNVDKVFTSLLQKSPLGFIKSLREDNFFNKESENTDRKQDIFFWSFIFLMGFSLGFVFLICKKEFVTHIYFLHVSK